MIDVLVCGIGGKMGRTVCEVLTDDSEAKVVCGVDIHLPKITIHVYSNFNNIRENVDVIIDFSAPDALYSALEWAKTQHVPAVLATTGYSKDHLKFIEECSKEVAIFKTANFSLGVNVLARLVQEAAKDLGENFDIEIIERHHRLKADAPSGTALMLAESANAALKEKKSYVCGRKGKKCTRGSEIGLHAVRGGTIIGEHEIVFAGEDEIVTLTHSAHSKKVFATGAVKAAKWIIDKPAGIYDMNDMLKNL